MQKLRIKPLIMCGGSGSRLWPASRESLPKQFIPLVGRNSTLQETVLRVSDQGVYRQPIIVTNSAQRFMVERQLTDVGGKAKIVVEPERRDSGPAILAGCLLAAKTDPRALVLVLAADHVIENPEAFNRTVMSAAPAALAGHIVTFGVEPTGPSTEYGYIEPGDPLDAKARAVVRFAEKPNAAAAAGFCARGLLWNSGNFLLSPRVLMEEYGRLDPNTYKAVVQAVDRAADQSGVLALDHEPFSRASKRSIDYAVMEHTRRAAVVNLTCGWSDVGSWNALWELNGCDENGNSRENRLETVDSRNCQVSSDGALTCLVGVENLVVVSTRDAVLVADRHRSGEVKQLVDRLRQRGHPEADTHMRVNRPWGWYQVIDSGHQYQVKRIAVYPNGRLSLQRHRYRSEHWVVVSGTATVTVDDEVRVLSMNDHVHVPLGAIHRLENFGNSLVEIIEVQNGAYLGEDDIERLEDVYHRVPLKSLEQVELAEHAAG